MVLNQPHQKKKSHCKTKKEHVKEMGQLIVIVVICD